MYRYSISTTHKVLVTGIVLAVFGVVITLIGWPGTESTEYNVWSETYETTEHTGSWVAVGFGLILAAVGEFLVMVAAIAYGVRIGTPEN